MPRPSYSDTVWAELARALDAGAIDIDEDEDDILDLLYHAIAVDEASKRSNAGEASRRQWTLDDFNPVGFRKRFRFECADDVRRFMRAIDFPARWTTASGCVFTGEEAMSLYLRRMTYPARFCDLQDMGFTAQASALSDLFKDVGMWMYETHARRLLQGGMTKWRHRAQMYADAIDAKTGVPYGDIIGFIDGTSRAICRPSEDQREVYDGHHHTHALAYLSVVGPDGLFLFTHGPESGRRNDNFMVSMAALVYGEDGSAANSLMGQLHAATGKAFRVYGDSAFANTHYSHSAYPRARATPQELVYNNHMNSGRIVVEWGFGDVIVHFAYLDFEQSHKLLLSPVAIHYLNGHFLWNCITCLYGDKKTGAYFDCEPPTLEEYIALTEVGEVRE